MSSNVFNSLRTVTAVSALCSVLSACSVNGTYPDATEPDAAKLRFISTSQNATLDYFDAQHCDGLTTGILNNIFLADTRRRVDMKIAPPADAKGYLEIKLTPGKEAFLKVNTLASSSVCGTALNLTPKAGTEYELTLDDAPGQCTFLLERLTRINGKEVRQPMPMFETGLPACNGHNRVFPAPLPDTAERTALIDAIVETKAQSMPGHAGAASGLHDKVSMLFAERKAQLAQLKLPDDYWVHYLQNLEVYEREADQRHERALEYYKKVYRMRLQGTDDQMLKRWLHPDSDDARAIVEANDKIMLRYYQNTSKAVVLDTIDRHVQRMSQLDKRFSVCERSALCWQY